MVPVFRLHRGRTHAMHSGLEAIWPVTNGLLIQESELKDGAPSAPCLLTVPALLLTHSGCTLKRCKPLLGCSKRFQQNCDEHLQR
jgi:hypothetical protein